MLSFIAFLKIYLDEYNCFNTPNTTLLLVFWKKIFFHLKYSPEYANMHLFFCSFLAAQNISDIWFRTSPLKFKQCLRKVQSALLDASSWLTASKLFLHENQIHERFWWKYLAHFPISNLGIHCQVPLYSIPVILPFLLIYSSTTLSRLSSPCVSIYVIPSFTTLQTACNTYLFKLALKLGNFWASTLCRRYFYRYYHFFSYSVTSYIHTHGLFLFHKSQQFR